MTTTCAQRYIEAMRLFLDIRAAFVRHNIDRACYRLAYREVNRLGQVWIRGCEWRRRMQK